MQGRPRDIVTSAARREYYVRKGWWDDTHLSKQVARFAVERGDKIAVVDLGGARERTYSELDQDINRVANRLLGMGVQPGEIVSAQLPNWLETVIVDLAILRVGAVVNPMLPNYGARDLCHMLGIGGVRVIFTPQSYRGVDYSRIISGIRGDLPLLEHHVTVAAPEGDGGRFMNGLGHYAGTAPAVALDASQVSHLVFTSGTEATPKAVMHTEETLNCSVRADYAWFGIKDDDVIWMPSPIGHMTGLGRGVRAALYAGMTLVLQDRWDPAVAARLIEKYRCSFTTGATTFVRDLIECADSGARNLSSMRMFTSGGAPVPPEVVRVAERLGITVLRQYGSTEAKVSSANLPSHPLEKRLTTDGQVLPHIELEIRDSSGNSLVGAAGEIFVRSPATSVGFFNDPERTAATFSPEGWVRTGDLGVLDEDRFLTIVGRIKEIIIRGGLNIAPRELEQVILAHPAVADVAVVGLPDARLGETACACVVLSKGNSLTLGGLVEYMQSAGVAKFKLPQRLAIVDALPFTATGKVRKGELARMILEDGVKAG